MIDRQEMRLKIKNLMIQNLAKIDDMKSETKKRVQSLICYHKWQSYEMYDEKGRLTLHFRSCQKCPLSQKLMSDGKWETY